MYEFGTTREQLAAVAVAARQWALMNPEAFTHEHGPLTIEDVMKSRMVCDPLTVRDCCLVTDGGAALIMTSAERAKDLKQKPVRSEEHTSELQSLMRISYAVFCLKKKLTPKRNTDTNN